MSFIFTLVTPPSLLNQSIIDRVRQKFSYLNYQWLSHEEAIDFIAPASINNLTGALTLYQDIKKSLDIDEADFFITCSTHRKKRLLIADMDSTIVKNETLDDLAAEAGIGDRISAITERAMNGELDFETALKERIALLKNVSINFLEKTWNKTKLNEGAKILVATMKNHYAHTALISGGFTYFTEKVSQICQFDENHANQLSFQDNMLDGKIIPPILGKEAKLNHLQRLTKELSLSNDETMAIGDGANDLPMLSSAGLGIGFYPKPIVAEKIINKIQHTSLLSALFVQGYKRNEFTSL